MEMNKKQLVLGFIFNAEQTHVLLIHKNRPEWQKGKINGIGGKLESSEQKKAGIKREVMEETGLIITDWTYVGRLSEPGALIHIFTTIYHGKMSEAQTVTDEAVEWFSIYKLPKNVISNLTWLIPLCKDKRENNYIRAVTITNK